MTKQLRKILDHYGFDNQKLKLAEECSELIRAIARDEMSKTKRNEDFSPNFTEEVADVLVLINQFFIYDPVWENEVRQKMNEKIDRTIERMYTKD